ncbi:putative disease resistance protein RGA4 [Cicer arietinum]|uniref:Disease resistance protein RGA4 n=1 Tax=Cicer arietinum TaxID=3827 RepID=A0A1S3DYJ2_CICAR|nr:putative disease resistance protein RGA4 [Cicer arietinum]XP_012568229.1 putative disease resistance protein RGA4 [Cicer arietinum]
MAEAVLELVLHNLSSLIQNELGLFFGFDRDLKSLASLLTTIKATLEDAEEQQFSNRAIKDWLLKLKDAAHVLDDILDECATKALEMEYKGLSRKVQSSFLSSFHPKHVAFRYKIAKKMKSIRERLDEVAEEKSKFHLTEIVREKRIGVLDWRQTTSIISQPQVYGRDGHKDKIVDFLVGDGSQLEDLSVYPIVGLGGLGKTTLAQLVFNDERIVNHFELSIWVCVSEDFSLKRMTRAIIESTTKKACEDLDLEPLQRRLQDVLQRKRYLLVLDDVWNEKQEKWRELKPLLACGGKGASILVTTRLWKVAKIMGTTPPHELSKLSDIDCWGLFKQRAFGPNEVEQAELVVIGKEIIKKCGGVPLAAIALGSLLCFKREEKEWLYIKESKLWNLQDEDYVMPALRLSYLNLSVKLRQCFAICALFPKDERINKQFLIELWMANGFISSNEMLDEEDIGNEVWNELYWRSFFQDIEIDEFGKVRSFKMHDLVHDLAHSVSEDVCCITNNDDILNTFERIRHLSFYRESSIWEVNSIQLRSAKSLKTYTRKGVGGDNHLPRVLNFYSLRALELEYIEAVPSSIGHLKHLRYLNLSWSDFETLPESICKLWNLQILKLDNCYKLQQLPNNLIRLKALKHLSLIGCYLSCLPPQIGRLASLKTLSMYIVGQKKGFFLEELGQLNLKGKLHIKHLERVKSVRDAKEANMLSKHLSHLWLSWERNEEFQLQENVEQILDVLQPHIHQLQELGVEGYQGMYFPHWMSSLSLNDLQCLYLKDCHSCLHLPQLAKLPYLKELFISNMSRLIYIDEESYNGGVMGGFIILKFLSLEKLPNLIRISKEDRENMFPHLSALEIIECPNLSGLPYLPSLDYMRIQGKCNQDLLSSIHKLACLESLWFYDNAELTCFPDGMLRNLTSLKTFMIWNCSKIEGFDEALQHMTSLESLIVRDLPNLTTLPESLGNLGLLHDLRISNCPKLTCLPMSIQSLTGLESLRIYSCSELEKRCEKETSEDWPKIAHVQNIEIRNTRLIF